MAYRKTERELARIEARRERMLVGACTLVSQVGFNGAQARDIATASGVSVGSLYSSFQGIREVHGEVFHRLAQREFTRVTDDIHAARHPAEQLAALVRGFGARALHAPQLAWALLLEPVAPNIETLRLRYRSRYIDLAATIVDEGVTIGEFPPQSVTISGSAIIGAIAESLLRPLEPASATPPRHRTTPRSPALDGELIEGIFQFCLRAIGAGQGGSPSTPPTCQVVEWEMTAS